MLIRGGRLIDPPAGIDALLDVRVSNVVVEIGEHLAPQAGEETLNASGAIVAPGFIDMHVHLRDPGQSHKETIETGTEAAVRGGFTAVACMANTSPALDNAAAVNALRREASARARCRVYPIAALTRERAGKEPCEYRALSKAGAVAFSDDGDHVADVRVLARAAELASAVRAPIVSHCDRDTELESDLGVAQTSGKAWHVAHVATKRSAELLRAARARGVRVTGEVTAHHLCCVADSAEARALGSAARVNPALGAEEDARALRDAVRDGTIEIFASDHAPHTFAEKSEGAPGFSGLEVAVGAYAAAIDDLPLARFVSCLSSAPAARLSVEGGTLVVGSRADVTIFCDEPWRVDAKRFTSLGKTTPFDGTTLPRRVAATIVGGEIRYRA